jgi:glycosyltransferase involved in cell wall biosynthesis
MKILHLGEYAKGGVATYLNQLIPYQQKVYGYNNVYLAISNKNSETFNNIEEPFKIRYTYNRDLKGLWSLRGTYKKIIAEVNPDIIHVHSTFAGFGSRLFTRIEGRKLIYTPHGWAFNQETSTLKKKVYALIERKLSSKADSITDISSYEMNSAIANGINKEKLTLIYNGVSAVPSYFDIPQEFEDSNINLLFIGRFDKQKGLEHLLEVFETKDYNNVNLYIIGESVLSNDRYSSEKSNVHFIGKVDNVHIDSYIKKVDAVIIPSRWEGFGLVAIEAMRNGKPCIVSDRGALPELVKDGINGYVFEFEDKRSLNNILQNLDKEDLKQKGLKGKRIFEENFTSEIMNEKIINLYSHLLKKSDD